MGKQLALVLYVVLMAAAVFAVDFLFFRNRFWERLIANVGIVLVFAAFYFRFRGTREDVKLTCARSTIVLFR